MEYHFVKLTVNGTYLSLVDPMHKPRFICFKERETAGKCVEYVSSFRARHGVLAVILTCLVERKK